MLNFYAEYSDTPLAMVSKHISRQWNKQGSPGYHGITIQINGSPVKTMPNDSTYRVRIWHSLTHPNEDPERFKRCHRYLIPRSKQELDPVDFTDKHFIVEFSISPTEDPIDLEKRYGEILRKYMVDEEHFEPTLTNFSAPVSRDSYLKNFHLRVGQILASQKEERVPMENGHFAPRKKGHSHQVNKR